MIDLLFDFFMQIFPEWMSKTMFGTMVDMIDRRIQNKYARFFVYVLIFMVSAVAAVALALIMIIAAAWIIIKFE